MLIVNGAASSVNARIKVVIRAALAADHRVDLVETNRRGHASRLARGAAAAGCDVVVTLGGDGTLNEAANGLAGTKTALATLPGGSTNVFARAIGLPNDAIEATAVLLHTLEEPETSIRSVGLGKADDRYFLFHCGLGFDAALVEQVERHASLKRWAGHPLFAWAGVSAWLRHYDHRRPRFAVRGPDGLDIEDAVFAIVANTNPYTYLGNRPFDVAPDTTLDTPLTAVVIRDLRLLRIGQLAAAALSSSDRLARVKGVTIRRDVSRCQVVGFGPFPYQMDGESMGYVDALEIVHVPGVLRLVTPAAPTPAA